MMLYTCTHVATVRVKGLKIAQLFVSIKMLSLIKY